MEPID